jgi:pyruvate,water dikinase
VATFDALIERHGSRSQGWELTQPTWRERPEAALALVRARLAAEGVSPAELSAGSEARRREATERVLARLPAATHAEFSSALAHLDGFVRIREGRAYWQMVLSGELRTLLLRIGASLAAEGKIAAAEDVFFLEPDDFEDGAASDLRPIVGERRRAWERWRAVEPPPLIGATGGPPATDAPARDGELRGSAASRGVVTGRARIIHSPEDGVRLQPGDILVCAASTPSWTPLFGVAAAIVSESGGPLSHPAITAREYGIPAVVAVKGATTAIRDGQTITVDGTAGVIRLA